jgi:dihydrodipicolinate synthase/N-acetylneuraminate lyase
MEPGPLRETLLSGLVIPAHPLALTAARTLDERRQRGLSRYYVAAGAGGIAVGVHTTQFAIHQPSVGLYRPVLELAADTIAKRDAASRRFVMIAGLVGPTRQAVQEAQLARELNYDCGLLSLGALRAATDDELIDHIQAVSEAIPVFGFYLQPAVGGRVLGYSFWRRFMDIEQVVAVKIAPFNRYGTLDVVRAAVDSGRLGEIALYTGNDDNILGDLMTPFRFRSGHEWHAAQIVGGLLGQWAVWTWRAVRLLKEVRQYWSHLPGSQSHLLELNAQLTDANAAIFDAANNFRGCVPGIHEVLRRQGLLEGAWCLDPEECLSAGQTEEIDRVCKAYPHLTDDAFVAEHRDEWLS